MFQRSVYNYCPKFVRNEINLSENYPSEIKRSSNVLTVIISIIKTNRLLVCVFCERTAITLVSYSVSVTVFLIRIGRERTIVLKRNEKLKEFLA